MSKTSLATGSEGIEGVSGRMANPAVRLVGFAIAIEQTRIYFFLLADFLPAFADLDLAEGFFLATDAHLRSVSGLSCWLSAEYSQKKPTA